MFENPGKIISVKTGEVAAVPSKRVLVADNEKFKLSTSATDVFVGVALTAGAAGKDEPIAVAVDGIVSVHTDGTSINKGDMLKMVADGKVASSSNGPYIGIAMSAAPATSKAEVAMLIRTGNKA